MQPSIIDTRPRFDGPEITPADHVRLAQHMLTLTRVMADGLERSLGEVATAIGCSESAAGSRLRDLRKQKFGSFQVTKRRVGNLYLYRVQP